MVSGNRKCNKNLLQTAAIKKNVLTYQQQSITNLWSGSHWKDIFHALIAVRYKQGGLNQIYRTCLILNILTVNINFAAFSCDPNRQASDIK